MKKQNRKVTRNKVWEDTIASIRYKVRNGNILTKNKFASVEARVDNISAGGMLILTDAFLPSSTELYIRISFSSFIKLDARGTVLRKSNGSIAIGFSEIDAAKLGECIMSRLNLNQAV